MEAVKEKIQTETISKVLYPSDAIESGKALRFVQQYFFVSCAIQDIIRRFLEKSNDFAKMPDYVVCQLNDTHPALAIPEMMRLLMDVHGQEWDTAWEITTKIFAYTNHTLLPEALETWPSRIVGKILPRHLQIIYEINRRFMDYAREKFGNDSEKLGKVSIVSGEGDNQIIRMANLSIVGGQRRCQTAFRTDKDVAGSRILRTVAGKIYQRYQRYNAAPLAAACQHGAFRPHFEQNRRGLDYQSGSAGTNRQFCGRQKIRSAVY